MIELENNDLDEYLKTTEYVLVNYYASWCLPCKRILENLMKVKDEFTDKIKIINVNVDNHSVLAIQKSIHTIPQLMYYKNGNLYLTESGLRTREHLKINIDVLFKIEVI
jgi:thioredoxin 1